MLIPVETPEQLTAELDGQWLGRIGRALCPAHPDTRPSLEIGRGQRAPIVVVCRSQNCDQRAIWRAIRDRGIAVGSTRSTAEHRSPVVDPRELDAERQKAVASIWRICKPAAGGPVATYLAGRSITLPVPPSLRWCAALKHSPTGTFLGAMVAGVQAPDRKICALHRTFLKADGSGKAPVSVPKMALGPLGAGAVRLAKAGPVVGLAEGIETAMAAMQLHQVPVWCALSAPRLDKVDLPAEVRRVIVFADTGTAGMEGAERAAKRYRSEGRSVEITPPPAEFGDWNDALQAGWKGATT